MMLSRPVRLGLVVAASILLLQGCIVTDEVTSWFTTSGKKSNLRGVRIPVMSLDEALKPDPELAKTPVVLPPPYRNTEWPLPGGRKMTLRVLEVTYQPEATRKQP